MSNNTTFNSNVASAATAATSTGPNTASGTQAGWWSRTSTNQKRSYREHPGFIAIGQRVANGEMNLLKMPASAVYAAVTELQTFDIRDTLFLRALQKYLTALRKQRNVAFTPRKPTKRSRAVDDDDDGNEDDDVRPGEAPSPAAAPTPATHETSPSRVLNFNVTRRRVDSILDDPNVDFSLFSEDDLQALQVVDESLDAKDTDTRQMLERQRQTIERQSQMIERQSQMIERETFCREERADQHKAFLLRMRAAKRAKSGAPSPSPAPAAAPARAPVPAAPAFAAAAAASVATGQGFSLGTSDGVRASSSSLFDGWTPPSSPSPATVNGNANAPNAASSSGGFNFAMNPNIPSSFMGGGDVQNGRSGAANPFASVDLTGNGTNADADAMDI